MTRQQLTIIDTAEGIFASRATLDATALPAGAQVTDNWGITHQRLHGGLSEGVDVVHVNNGTLQLAVLPTRGMGIWKGSLNDIPLQWNSPVTHPVNPAFVDQSRRGGIGWLDGFNELICRCGLGWPGAPGTDVVVDENGNTLSEQFLPLHGRIANLPAHKVQASTDEAGTLQLTGTVEESSMFGGRLQLTSVLTTALASNRFRIQDTVTNLASATAEVEMLYHCNIGQPFLGAGSSLWTAASEIAPRDARAAQDVDQWSAYSAPQSGYAEQVYFMKPIADSSGKGLAVLVPQAQDIALAVRFDLATLPWFAQWKNTQAEQDGYVTGLEPASSFPNLRSFERQQGRVIQLAPDQSVTFDLEFEIASTPDQVNALREEVTHLQNSSPTKIHPQPNPNWSA
jgi:galactose mutarotase-like enzyme